jgi:hypothetical protein
MPFGAGRFERVCAFAASSCGNWCSTPAFDAGAVSARAHSNLVQQRPNLAPFLSDSTYCAGGRFRVKTWIVAAHRARAYLT